MPGKMKIIKASAGSGKTYRLTLMYIEHLLTIPKAGGKLELRRERNYHRHILAITFTNKATEEMKERIVRELRSMATNLPSSNYYSHFQKHCTPQALNGLQAKAQQALVDILMDYGTFAVSTIDAFFQRVLRTFARELDRDYSYELQLDDKVAIQAAIHTLLMQMDATSRHSGKQRLMKWLEDSIGSDENDLDWRISRKEDNLVSLASEMNSEAFVEKMDDVRAYLRKTNSDGTVESDFSRIAAFRQALIARRNEWKLEFEDKADSIAQDFQAVLDKHGVQPKEIHGGKAIGLMLKSGIKSPDWKPTEGLIMVADCFEGPTTGMYDYIIGQFTKAGYRHGNNFDLQKELKQTAAGVVNAWRKRQILDGMIGFIGQLGLIERIDHYLELYRRQNNSLLIGDTGELISRILKAGVPYVYERFGELYDHFMIDEFQDTSAQQYENFKDLLHDALSRGNEQLLIGDSKQSIYRFRNAEPKIFREQVEKDFAQQKDVETLDTNYRSLSSIIHFNNRLFTQLMADGGIASMPNLVATYNDVVQKVSPKKAALPPGLVRVGFTDHSLTPIDKIDQVINPNFLPEYLHYLHKRFSWGQMLILVNVNKDGKNIVESLVQYNEQNPDKAINVRSGESLRLSLSPCVRMIIAMLRYLDLAIDEPDSSGLDDEMKDLIARTLKRQRQNQRFMQVLSEFGSRLKTDDEPQDDDAEPQDAGKLLYQILGEIDAAAASTAPVEPDKAPVHAMGEDIADLLPDSKNEMLTLPNIVEHIIGRMAAHDGICSEHDTPYLLALQDAVNEFARTGGSTLHEFLRYWDTQGDKITLGAAEGVDAVEVITIHKAKGLERDCVIIPYFDWELNKTQDKKMWFPLEKWQECHGSELLGLPKDLELPPMIPVELTDVRDKIIPIAENDSSIGSGFSDFFGNFMEEVCIDSLNKTYVAFTRPRNELHIIGRGKEPKNESSSPTVLMPRLVKNLFLHNCIEGMQPMEPTELPNLFTRTLPDGQDSTLWFQMGEPWDTEPAENENEGETMPRYRVNAATDHLRVRLDLEGDDKRNDGKRIHAVMRLIDRPADIDKALKYCLKRGLITAKDDDPWNEAHLRDLLERAMKDERTRDWFDPRNVVINERSIVYLQNEEHHKRRPDRIIRRPDGSLIVIDFKTGKELDKHRTQLHGYLHLLAPLAAGNPIGYLWYLSLDKVVPVRL